MADRTKPKTNGQLILNKTYEEVNMYSDHEEDERIPEKGFHKSIHSKHQQPQPEVTIEKQPLYFEEVDHHIEEVGIMAVKEVRYLTEKQWELMIKKQKNNQEIWKYLENAYKYQARHQIASQRERNSKGQFLSKEKSEQNVEKNKKIKKRGRPKKVRQNQNDQQQEINNDEQ